MEHFGRATPLRLRGDLTVGLPRFRTQQKALQAVGLLARVSTANVGLADSDQRDVRRKRYEAKQAG